MWRRFGTTPPPLCGYRSFAPDGEAPAPPPEFNPLTDVSWHSAFWAEDPDWSHPAAGGLVDSWRDGSGNGHTITQASSAAQPTYRASGGAFTTPHVQFTTSRRLDSEDFTTLTGRTAWVAVVEISNVTQVHRILAGTKTSLRRELFSNATPRWSMFGGTSTITGGTPVSATKNLLVGDYGTSGVNARLLVNGVEEVAGSLGTLENLNSIRMGSNGAGTTYLVGRIAFAALYEGSVTDDPGWAGFTQWVSDHYGI